MAMNYIVPSLLCSVKKRSARPPKKSQLPQKTAEYVDIPLDSNKAYSQRQRGTQGDQEYAYATTDTAWAKGNR